MYFLALVHIGFVEEKGGHDIIASFCRYVSESRNYEAFPEVNDNEGNCNTISTGMLAGAGVDIDVLKAINPRGFNPVLGIPLPEMLASDKQKCKK